MKKILIIGGVAGGAAAAARLRRLDENIEIIMFEKGPHISFANCGLPYYLGNVIEDRDELLVMTPEKFKGRFNVDVRTKNEVLTINKIEKSVTVKDLEKGETYKESYDQLILSPGASPLIPPIKGIDNEKIFTLRNVVDVDAIHNFMENNQPKKAVVIGGGFIGLEVMENFQELGMEVSLVEMMDQVMAPLDKDIAEFLHEEIKSHGVNLILNNGVDSFIEKDGSTFVKLQNGDKIEADIIILSIGVRPNTRFVKESGIDVTDRGLIITNEYMETSAEDIYAVGDAVQIENFITKEKTAVPLASMANKQARIVANNIAGEKETYQGSIGTSIAKVFNLAAGSAGLNEKDMLRLEKEINTDYKVVLMHGKHHVGYYPDAKGVCIKMLYNPSDRKVLGAQVVGEASVDKKTDIFATVIRLGGTIDDLKALELCYAPPYGGAKDLVNNVGFIASNIEKGLTRHIECSELKECSDNNSVLLDVRDYDEVEECGLVNDAQHIPLNELRDRLSELPKDKKIYIYCAAGLRGYIADRILLQNNFDAYNIAGGFKSINTTLGCDF
jgi:NADPH-dependent 2,4-dienoyl-CoA reductase/sulfur reductase-like enzyme/rhodanese-related sulfurtransferase